MIEITCPSCARELQIDPGFAGGVCRCFNCGTMMTVPEDANQAAETIEQSARPDRPDAPPGSPGSGDQAGTKPGVTTFVTASGRQINLTESQLAKVPTAEKRRMGVRVGVVVTFIVFMLILVVGMILLIGNLVGSMEQGPTKPNVSKQIEQEAKQATQQALGYDPAANPFILDTPNLIGIPADKATVLVVDTSGAMADSLDYLKELIPANMKTIDAATNVQVLLSGAGKVTPLPATLTPRGQIDMTKLITQLESTWPDGPDHLAAGIAEASKSKPNQIILIGSATSTTKALVELESALRQANTQLHVVLLGTSSDPLRKLTEITGGQYTELPSGQLTQWYEAYANR